MFSIAFPSAKEIISILYVTTFIVYSNVTLPEGQLSTCTLGLTVIKLFQNWKVLLLAQRNV